MDRTRRRRRRSRNGGDDGSNSTIDSCFGKEKSGEELYPPSIGTYIPKKPKLAKDSPNPENGSETAESEDAAQPSQQYRFLMNRCEVSLPVKPYPTQIAIMNAITKSANKSENVLIESATGTGKSLALICASLAAARRLTMAKLETAQPRPPQMPSELPVAPVSLPGGMSVVPVQPQLLSQPQPQSQPVPKPAQQQSAPEAPQPPKEVERFMGLPLKPHVDLESLKALQAQYAQSQDEDSVDPHKAQPAQVFVKTENDQAPFTQQTQPIQLQTDSIYQSQFTQQTQQTQPIQLQTNHSIYSQQTQPAQVVVKTENDQALSTRPTQPTQFQTDSIYQSQFTQQTQQTQPSSLQNKPEQTPKSQPFQKPIVVQPIKHAEAGGFIPAGAGAPPSQAPGPADVHGNAKTLVRVFYGTRTHSQVKQIVKEVRRTMYKPLTVVLASRKHYCIFDKVRDSPERDDICVKMMLRKVNTRCPYASTEALKRFVRQPCGTTKVPGTDFEHKDYRAYDVEDLVEHGRRLGSCPYLSMNELVEEAELVVSPYNYIISESIRTSRHITLSDDIVVIDEAHNISNALMEVASYDLTQGGLLSVCIGLRTAAKTGAGALPEEYRASLRYAARILQAIANWMGAVESTLVRQDFERYSRCWRGPEILEIYKGFGLPSKEHLALFTYAIDCACGKVTFSPEAVAPYKAVLRLSGLLEEGEGEGEDSELGLGGESSAGAMARGLREEEPKYYRKESKASKPRYSRDSPTKPTGLSSSPFSAPYGGKGGKRVKRPLGSGGDDSEEKVMSILEGSEMICASMASSSAGFILNHPEYANDYRLVVDKAAMFVGGGASSRGSSGRRGGGNSGVGNAKEWVMSLGLWCMSPAVAFKGIVEPSRSVVLASGTLAPFDPLVQELRAPFPTRVELSHVIDKCQVIACTARRYEISYSTTDSLDVQDYVGRSVLECCRVIPSGVLCFLPSYSLLSKLVARWKETGLYDEILRAKGGNVYSELDVSKPQGRAGSSDAGAKKAAEEAKFSVFINNFHRSARTPEGALLFAVCRGKSSEGVDFADETARGVIIVGTPYSNTHEVRIALKREYEEAACKGAGTRWYLADGHRAVNQAIGRIIRNKWDYGAVVFLDARYTRLNVKCELSKWIRNQIYEVDTVHDFVPALKDFFENIPPYVAQKKEEFMSKMASQSSQQSSQQQQPSQQSTQSTQSTQIKSEKID